MSLGCFSILSFFCTVEPFKWTSSSMEAELLWLLWQISIDGKSFLEISYWKILHKISERSPVLKQIFVQHTTMSEYSPCGRASAAKSKRKLPAHHQHQQTDANFHHGKSYSIQLWSSYCIRFAGFLPRMACGLLGPYPYRTNSWIFTTALSELNYYQFGSTCMERMTITLQHYKNT